MNTGFPVTTASEYYSAIKNNTFESVLMRWMKLESIIQSEVSQKEKHQYSILTHHLLLGRKVMSNLDSIFKSRDITLSTKVHLLKAIVFPAIMYGCESWTVKKAEHRRIDAFELWCWRRFLRVPWTARDPTSPF